jgi:4-carboxymuconolactone decarboxylase
VAAGGARSKVALLSGYRLDPGDLDPKVAEISQASGEPPGRLYAVIAAAACAQGDRHFTRGVLRAALAAGTGPETLRETLLQTYLFAGYPRAINALADLASLAPVPDPVLDLEADLGRDGDWLEAGRALCARVYGPGYDRLLPLMAKLSPELGRWMITEGYGKVLSRPDLDPAARELAAIGALMVLDVPLQLRAHLRGALHVGADRGAVDAALAAAALVAPRALEPARALLADVAAHDG